MNNSRFDYNEAQRVYNVLGQVLDRAKGDIDELRNSNPTWNKDSDIRITGFAKLVNAHWTVLLAIKFYADCLIKKEWWDANSRELSSEDKKRINRAFMDLQKIGLIQVGFLAMESTLRELLRVLDADACNGSTDAFKNVYECLVRTKLPEVNQDGCALLDLMRVIRNTIHNNGVYFSKSGGNEAITYKNVAYEFRHREKPDFITWDLIGELHEDSRILLGEIVRHPRISNIAGTISDPYA